MIWARVLAHDGSLQPSASRAWWAGVAKVHGLEHKDVPNDSAHRPAMHLNAYLMAL